MYRLFKNKLVNQIISILVLFSFINLIHGCYYYKVTKSPTPPESALAGYQSAKKYIILHEGKNAWHFTNIIVEGDSVRGTISKILGHELYKTTNPEKPNRYRTGGENAEPGVINEVHLYVKQMSGNADTTALTPAAGVSIPLASVDKIEVYDRDTGTTTASWIFGTLGTIALGAALILVIVALTKESCPFIYVADDSSLKFVGEIYSGAIYPSLERPDYLPLPSPQNGQRDYNIKMTNEVHEIQNTNLIELNVFDHPEGTNVYIDKYGNYQTTSELQAPQRATDLIGKDILEVIKNKDSLSYLSAEPGKDPALNDGVILTFKNPGNTGSAKLVVNTKSTFWLDYVFTRFHELFGKEYDCWVDKQQTVSPLKMKTWMLEQKIPLSVYIEKKGKWKFVDYYNIVGPMALKEDLLPLDISDIKSDSVRIKLEYGNLFWEIDYAAIDFSTNIPVRHTVAQFVSAIDEQERDVKYLLTSTDLLYYIQPEVGNAVNMKFKLPEPVKSKQTLILHSQGYYKILLDLTGEQQKKELIAFMKKGHFAEFSNQILQKQLHINSN